MAGARSDANTRDHEWNFWQTTDCLLFMHVLFPFSLGYCKLFIRCWAGRLPVRCGLFNSIQRRLSDISTVSVKYSKSTASIPRYALATTSSVRQDHQRIDLVYSQYCSWQPPSRYCRLAMFILINFTLEGFSSPFHPLSPPYPPFCPLPFPLSPYK